MNIEKPSVQSLLIEMRFQSQPISTGTGFLVETSKGVSLVTNRHNVTGRHQDTGKPLSPTGAIPDEMVIVHNKKDSLGQWITRLERLVDSDNNGIWHEHPSLGSDADIVALLLTEQDDIEVIPYDIQNTGPDVRIGPSDSVSVVGFPFGIRAGGALAVWATGFMASEPEVDFRGQPVFLIDCRSRSGQSGSAVIAHRSGGAVAMKSGSTAMFAGPITKFLGVYSGRINTESDLGIVWKASALRDLIGAI